MTSDRHMFGRYFSGCFIILALSWQLAGCQGRNSTDSIVPVNLPTAGPDDLAEIIDGPGSIDMENWRLRNTIHFETDSYALSDAAQGVLRQQVQWLTEFPAWQVTVEGHADERGTREYNLALGERRANAAASYLVASGIDAARLSVISYGKERPDCSPATDICWAQNRRAVTALNISQ